MVACSQLSDRSGQRRSYVWPPLMIGAGAFFGLFLVGHGGFTVSFILLIVAAAGMYAPYGPYFALIPELLPRASAGPAVGLINAFGVLGGFLGTYLVGAFGGGTPAAFLFLAGCVLASALLMFFVHRPEGAIGAARQKRTMETGPVPAA